jgi:hypothetical protein
MTGTVSTGSLFIGWDVGGWNCDAKRRSRDALVILDSNRQIIGHPWRGNLRIHINETKTAKEWIKKLFTLCNANHTDLCVVPMITMAIDTPLGFSEDFIGLVTDLNFQEPIGDSNTNCYLLRKTERYLYNAGLSPLSAVKDMIGSQATKGMHVLAKYSPTTKGCGVWTDGRCLQVIEAYPSACKGSRIISQLVKEQDALKTEDEQAALICALVAYLFVNDPSLLEPPGDNIPSREGWIWVPRDVF